MSNFSDFFAIVKLLLSTRAQRRKELENSTRLLAAIKNSENINLSEVMNKSQEGYGTPFLGERKEVGFPLYGIYKLFHKKDFDEESDELSQKIDRLAMKYKIYEKA